MSWQTGSTTRAARRCLLGALFSGALVLPAAAQEHDEEWFPPELGPPPGVSEDEHDHQSEIVEIFHEVELSLRDIDGLLISAGAGEIPLEELRESGISRLLRGSQQKSDQVVAGIDRLLEVSNGSCPSGAS